MTLYRCRVKGVLPSGRAWSFRMHFTSGAPIATVEADWLSHINGAWTGGANPLQAIFPVATVLDETTTESLVAILFPGPPPVTKLRATANRLDTTTLPGTAVNPAEADQVSVLVSAFTNIPGREGRGRIHLPAPDQTLVTASALSSVTAGHVSTAINGVLTNMAVSGHTGVLVNYVQSKTGTLVGTTQNITAWRCDEVLRTVRGRVKHRRAVYV